MAVRVVTGAVLFERLLIPSDTAGITLQLRRKRPAGIERFAPARTVLLMHGATFPGESLFDVPMDGGSTMEVLAARGFDVYALDARGYGGSTRPAEMDAPPEDAAPLVRTEVAVRDLRSAVAHVLRARGLDRLSLLGMSWGGSVAGAYAAAGDAALEKLVLVAPQWLTDAPVRIDAGGTLGAWRRVDVRGFHERWLAAAPAARRAGLIPPGAFAEWARVTLATDPAERNSGFIRAPPGAVQDVRAFWTAGRPVYDPGAIRVPVLLLHGEWDADVTIERTLALFGRLDGARYRRWVEVGAATHMLLLERERWQALDAIAGFLDETGPA